jgi:hypothetical protein
MMSLRTSSCGGRKLPTILAALLLLSSGGCASLTTLNFKTEKIPTTDAQHPAIEILAIWQASEGPGPKGIPVRGFAGQIFFFAQDRATPVAVDGTTRIYLFDDHGSVEEQARPLHQFDFDRASWAGHLQRSTLGPTYGVFIPYPRNDYHQAVCSLRVRFTTPKTRPLYSVSSTIALPGPPMNPETAQNSPFSSLTKKMREQPQLARNWQSPSSSPELGSLNRDSQLMAAQPQVAAAQLPGPVAAASGSSSGSYSIGPYATVQTAQSTRSNPIIQTAGTMDAAVPGAPPDPMAPVTNSVGTNLVGANSVGFADLSPQGAAPSSGRIRLQAATPATVTHASWSSDTDGSNAEDQRDALAGQSPSHANHPLAD